MSILSEQQLTRYRVPLLAIACLQAFFTSGIFYGWASLYTLFLEAGVYANLCDDEGECTAQKDRLTFIYTVASSVNLCSQLPWGLVLDFLGPRVANMWSTALVIVGFVLLSLSARGIVDGYMLAMCLIGGAGPGAQISLFHLSELFPVRQKSTVLSIVTGAFQLGFIVFLLWHLAFMRVGLDLSTLAMLYCVPLTLLLLLGGVLWPDQPCIPPDDVDPLSFTSREPAPHKDEKGVLVYDQIGRGRSPGVRAERGGDEDEEVNGEEGRQYDAHTRAITVKEGKLAVSEPQEGRRGSRTSSSGASSRTSSVSSAGEIPGGEEQPLMRNQRSEGLEGDARGFPRTPPDYGALPDPHSSPSLHYVHRSLHALKVTRSLPNLKGMTASNPFMQQLLSPSFAACLLWMCICIFWANFYIGTCAEQLYVKSGGDVAATRHYTSIFTLLLPSGLVGIGAFGYLTDVLGFSSSSAVTCLFGVGFACSSLFLPLEWQVLTFVLYSFFRAFLFSCMFAYLAHEFGYRHFGLLSGIILMVGGALGGLQYALEQAMVADEADDGTCEGCGKASFAPVNRLQLAMLLPTFFFPLYVYIKQRMRVSRVDQQIQQHARHLATVY